MFLDRHVGSTIRLLIIQFNHDEIVTVRKRITFWGFKCAGLPIFQIANHSVQLNHGEAYSDLAVWRKFFIFQQPCVMLGTEIDLVQQPFKPTPPPYPHLNT